MGRVHIERIFGGPAGDRVRSWRSLFLLILPLAFVGCAATGSSRTTSGPSTAGGASAAASYDVVIEGGRIVDGTGSAWFFGDLAISGDRIVRIAPRGVLAGVAARQRVDARGKVVSPGFIDIQGQSRPALLRGDGRVVSKVTQGITTEILGEGNTNAPVNERLLAAAGAPTGDAADQAREFSGPGGFDRWLRAMEANGISPNVGSFVGATTLRVYGMGEAMGPATSAALDSMRKAARWAMEDGAFGLSSALIYPPGTFAATAELIELAKATAPYGGVYITHMRSEADRLLEAIDEAIQIGKQGGVAVEIYHLKAAGTANWPKAAQAIAKIDSARAAGLDVQANMYPYVAGGTGLTACFPPWASADGKLMANLANAEMRGRIRAEIEHQTEDWENLCTQAAPAGVLVLGLDKPDNLRWRGMRLSDIASGLGKDWIETAMDLVLSEGQRINTIYFLMSEENVALQLRQPWIKFGTDAGGVDPESATDLAHPRAYGTFPRILGKYVREERVLPLEEAVRKMSSAVATRLGIQERGLLREGFYADVVVFDPATVGDRATFEMPHQLSVGIEQVFVNGVAVVRDGRHTGAKPGRIVRGPGWVGEASIAGGGRRGAGR